MNQKRIPQALLGLVLLFTLFGCGKSQAPKTNPPAVETSLAGTARALAKQTETAQGFTQTPSPIPTRTLTPTPKISLSGTSLTMNNDGSALFIDHKAGVQLTIPAGWMALRVNEKEYYDAFTAPVVVANPALSERLTQIQDENLQTFRLDAFDIRDGHIPNGVISDINVIFQPGDTRTLEQLWKVEGNTKKPFKNFKFVSMEYPKLADGTRILMLDQTWTKDKSNSIYYRRVIFSLNTGTLILDFYSNKDFKDTVLPDFQQIVDSVKLLTP